jgi:hypothetical protein
MVILLHINENENFTFKISGFKALGPLEENAATRGAGCAPITAFAPNILDIGLLFNT